MIFSDHQRVIDAEHLRMLRIAYLVSAGISGFIACFGLLYVFVGTMIEAAPELAYQPGMDEFPSAFFIVGGVVFFAIAALAGLLRLYTARCLRLRKNHVFCQFMAAISCIDMPYGTALGVISLILLSRPSIRALFGHGEPQAPPLETSGS